ncbi:MAG TPA: YihY/virulence factor BrkB family protein [Chthoniobacter sp.]|nr:YihY/virulence factor BrkB family protein [Chthoniobacter sp.]
MTAFERFTYRARPAIRRWLAQRWAIFWRALVKYDETDGEQRAASFAYYAFFAMFPLIVLLITLATNFFGSRTEATAKITSFVSVYHLLPLEQKDSEAIISTIDGVVQSRKSAGLIALGILVWSALKFFQALVYGVNRAWGTKQYSWWRMPIKNLSMTAILASALLLGSILPSILNYIDYLYWKHSWEFHLDFIFVKTLFQIIRLLVPPLVLFYGFAMFYKFAPRRRTLLREVWPAALFVTFSFEILQFLFLLYTKNIGDFNKLYGTFGTVVALLLWIYLSGSIIILGGCLSAAKYEIEMSLTDQATSNRERD